MVGGERGLAVGGALGMRALTGLSLVALSALFWSLKPSMLDGDGLQHAGDAIFHPAFGAMDLKHLLVPAALKVAVGLSSLLDRGGRVIDFLLAENGLATLATFVLLARFVFPRVIQDLVVAWISALGTVLSYGVLSRSASLEVYSIALLADVVLVAYCLSSGLGGPWRGRGPGRPFRAGRVGPHHERGDGPGGPAPRLQAAPEEGGRRDGPGGGADGRRGARGSARPLPS